MKIFVIIVTYESKNWVDKYVGELRTSTVPVTPIVIDNDSSDGTAEYIRQTYPDAILLKSDINLGFARANTQGIKKVIPYLDNIGMAEAIDYYIKNEKDYLMDSEKIKLKCQ